MRSLKLIHVSAISTGIVVFLGMLMVIPTYIQPASPQFFLLTFSVYENVDQSWCDDLASTIKKHNIQATIFFSGKIAEKFPKCVKTFPTNVDIGSQTYHYVSLSSIPDYTLQLKEIQRGKQAVDDAGNLNSKLFKAPYGTTDDNIYSLLTRSNIIADFSYDDQYNKYYNGQFIKFQLKSYHGANNTVEFFQNLPANEPIVINYDSSTPVNYIDNFISKIKSKNTVFLDASELTGLQLTIRNEIMT